MRFLDWLDRKLAPKSVEVQPLLDTMNTELAKLEAAYNADIAKLKMLKPAEVPVPAQVESSCSTYPMERQNHQAMIRADAGQVRHMRRGPDRGVWCDCCGSTRVAVFPMFNRLRHTVRLCGECMRLGLAAIDSLGDTVPDEVFVK